MSDQNTPPEVPFSNTEPSDGRKPFRAPVVEDLGHVAALTRLQVTGL